MNLQAVLQNIIASALIYSAPLILTALGGTFSERSGVINIGLEGIMVIGAFSSVVFNLTFAQTFGSWTPWVSMIVGGLVGVLFSLFHAVATINWRADHIISGTVINLLAPALALFFTHVLYDRKQTDYVSKSFGYYTVPVLSKIPVIGPILFKNTSAPAIFGIGVAILSWFLLYKTRFGLRLRSVGENPQAADTLGINVYKMKYAGVLLSGLLGGLGGAIQAQAIALNFSGSTVAGQGFIAMAAMIFGKWNPLGAMGAAIFFGFAQSLAVTGHYVPILRNVPGVWLQVAPYALTIIALIVVVGGSKGPAANGKTYIKSK